MYKIEFLIVRDLPVYWCLRRTRTQALLCLTHRLGKDEGVAHQIDQWHAGVHIVKRVSRFQTAVHWVVHDGGWQGVETYEVRHFPFWTLNTSENKTRNQKPPLEKGQQIGMAVVLPPPQKYRWCSPEAGASAEPRLHSWQETSRTDAGNPAADGARPEHPF